MKKLESDLLDNKYTEVYHEKEFTNNAPHLFEVTAVPQSTIGMFRPDDEGIVTFRPDDEGIVVGVVKFQEGPIKEFGVNGVMNEDLISMIICRLEHFNQSEFSCMENSMAITKLQESLMWLGKRTKNRRDRGIEGTHKV